MLLEDLLSTLLLEPLLVNRIFRCATAGSNLAALNTSRAMRAAVIASLSSERCEARDSTLFECIASCTFGTQVRLMFWAAGIQVPHFRTTDEKCGTLRDEALLLLAPSCVTDMAALSLHGDRRAKRVAALGAAIRYPLRLAAVCVEDANRAPSPESRGARQARCGFAERARLRDLAADLARHIALRVAAPRLQLNVEPAALPADGQLPPSNFFATAVALFSTLSFEPQPGPPGLPPYSPPMLKASGALALALDIDVPPATEAMPTYARQIRAVVGGALLRFGGEERWSRHVTCAMLRAALGALRAFVAAVERERADAENRGEAAAAQHRNRRAAREPAAAPWLVEESALRELLGLVPPRGELELVRRVVGYVGFADRHYRTYPIYPRNFDVRALLTQAGFSAIYDLYTGIWRTLAQRPYPAEVALPPPMQPEESALHLRGAVSTREKQRPTSPTMLDSCPRCRRHPRHCPAAADASTASLAVQLRRLLVCSEECGCVRGFPADDSLLAWRCAVLGPADTPWEGRSVELLLRFCGPYPFAPPLLFVLWPRPFHPNVDDVTGAVCMDLLQEQWSSAGGVFAVLMSFLSLLASPTLDDASAMPANVEAASMWRHAREDFEGENARRAASMPWW